MIRTGLDLTATHALRVGYDRAASTLTCAVDADAITTVAPLAHAPAVAPQARVFANLNLPAQAGAKGTLDATVSNVLVASAAPGACVTVDPQVAPTVTVTLVPSAPPLPTGGPVTPGTYFLTGVRRYTGAGGAAGLYRPGHHGVMGGCETPTPRWPTRPPRPRAPRASAGARDALGAHALRAGHDDALSFQLLPVWRAEFGLPSARRVMRITRRWRA